MDNIILMLEAGYTQAQADLLQNGKDNQVVQCGTKEYQDMKYFMKAKNPGERVGSFNGIYACSRTIGEAAQKQ